MRSQRKVNYPLYFIVKTLEEWERNKESEIVLTQGEYAKSKKVNLRTFKLRLKKQREGKIFMRHSSDI